MDGPTIEPASGPSHEEEAEPPRRGFGLATPTFVVVSSMVGTGVLTTSGYTAYFTGSNQVMLGLWLLGGVVAICGALTLAEVSAALPRSGGDYVFLLEAYGPLVAFLSGWVSFLIGFGGPIAVVASASARYLLVPARLEPSSAALARSLLATAAIVALAVVHSLGRRATARAQGGMTVVKFGILSTFAVVGLAAGWGHWGNLRDRPTLTPDVVTSWGSSLVYIFYAYIGWNSASYLAGEIERPQVRLPRAILLGTATVATLYLGLNLAYALAVTPEDLRRIVEDPANTQGLDAIAPIAQIAAQRLYGSRVSDPLSILVGLTLLASLSAYILTGPRVAFAMARAGQFPTIAGRLSRRETPTVATILQVGWALVLLWVADFEKLLLYAGVGLAIFTMLSVASIYVLRLRRPDLPRPFRTPGYPITPAVYLIATGCLTFSAFRERTEVSLWSLATILAGVPIYYAWTAFQRPRVEAPGPTS